MKKYLIIGLFLPSIVFGQEKDYQLTILDQKICVKSHETCLMAQIAIIKGYFLPDLPPNTPSKCVPYPNCFSQFSNVIK